MHVMLSSHLQAEQHQKTYSLIWEERKAKVQNRVLTSLLADSGKQKTSALKRKKSLFRFQHQGGDRRLASIRKNFRSTLNIFSFYKDPFSYKTMADFNTFLIKLSKPILSFLLNCIYWFVVVGTGRFLCYLYLKDMSIFNVNRKEMLNRDSSLLVWIDVMDL